MAKPKHVGLTPKDELIDKMRQRLNGNPPDVSVAFRIASDAFFMVNDRNGRSYMEHLMQACKSGTKSTDKQIVGLLHDLIEDTPWTLDDLRRVGFSDHVVNAIGFVTKMEGELYFDGVVRCGTSVRLLPKKHKYLAVDVKEIDLKHNMDPTRERRGLSSAYQERLKVYNIAYNYLGAIRRQEIKPGTSMTDFLNACPGFENVDLLLQGNSSDPWRPPSRNVSAQNTLVH